ncbi:MAG: valine--tRNA ligase, partial [Synergistetes bacterium]|nr:valine--tRNA ligase [Synergistota bacterium]
EYEKYIIRLASLSEFQIDPTYERPKGCAVGVMDKAEIFMPLGDLIDIEKEVARLKLRLQEVMDEISRVEAKLSNTDFIEKAPQHVVEKERAKLQEFQEIKGRIERHLEQLA